MDRSTQQATKSIEQLENLLNVSQDAIQNDIIERTSINVPVLIGEGNDIILQEEVAGTYILIKQNLATVIRRGQDLLDQTEGLDIKELKASDIEAITNLSRNITEQYMLMLEAQERVLNIQEKMKKLKSNAPNIPEGSNLTQNNSKTYVFAGSTADILKQIKENGL